MLGFLSGLFQLNAQESSGWVESQGVQIHYKTFGNGSPLLIINGGPGFSSEGFIPLAKALSKEHTTIIYDQRATGQSKIAKPDSSSVTMQLMTADIEALRKHLGYESWVVLGHSFGGIMANFYAAQHPERVEAMISSASGGLDLSLLKHLGSAVSSKLSPAQNDSLAYWGQRIRNGDSSFAARLGRARSLAPAYAYQKAHVPTIVRRLTQGDMLINQLVWRDLNRINYDCKTALSSFEKPVLLIQGKNDILPERLVHKADTILPNATVCLLDKCGHYGWLDRPDAYFEAVESFLTKIPPHDEKAAIETLLKRYINAVYSGDTGLVCTFADSSLQKSGHYYSPKSASWSVSPMRYDQLYKTTKTYNAKRWIPSWAPKEVNVYDISEKVASARVKTIWGFDYVLLEKTEAGWRMQKVLWQSYTPEERERYFQRLANQSN